MDFEIALGGAGVDGATVEDGDVFASFFAEEFGDMFANEGDHFGDIVGRGGLGVFVAGDGPDGLVGDNDFINVFFADIGEAAVELVEDSRFGFAVFSFGGGFANTEDRGEVVTNGGGDFGANVFVGFVEEVATLGVANEGVVNEAAELRDGGFAGIGAVIAPVEVLGGKFELATTNLEGKGLQRYG